MKQKCQYRKGADITEVVPGLGCDMESAITTGVIKDTSATTFHNMMEDTAEIGIVARDPFDIICYEQSYVKFRKQIEKDVEDKKSKK